MAYTTKQILGLVGASAVFVSALGMGLNRGPAIVREGDPAHIAALRAIEAQPFNVELFDGLDGWTLGQALSGESIKGKVVLIGVVASGDPQSMMMLSSLARYQRKNSDEGLVVLAVHPEKGWETISEKIAAGRIKVQVARDLGGAFVEGIQADSYPDLYLIDRAGQLRYADIENKSLKAAVAKLLRESSTNAIANGQDQADEPEVVIVEEVKEPEAVSPAAYTNANWPAHNVGKLYGDNFQGQQLPVSLGDETWITEKKDLEGKIILLDFWATWCGPCRQASPMFDYLQKSFEGKVEVLAIGGQSEDESTVRQYAAEHKVAYSYLFDAKQSIYRELRVTGIPHVVILSTDGVIRWQGFPQGRAFLEVLEQVVREDPMFAQD